mgnify:CR=1 FL=1
MMKDIIKDILEMPYYRNYAAGTGKVHNVANHEKPSVMRGSMARLMICKMVHTSVNLVAPTTALTSSSSSPASYILWSVKV